VFRVGLAAFRVDTSVKMNLPLLDCCVNHWLVKSHADNALTQ